MIRFHVGKDDTKVAENDKTLDCDHPVKKGDVFYVAYDFDIPVLYICRDCVIVDTEKEV
jgi:hypothetical protein